MDLREGALLPTCDCIEKVEGEDPDYFPSFALAGLYKKMDSLFNSLPYVFSMYLLE